MLEQDQDMDPIPSEPTGRLAYCSLLLVLLLLGPSVTIPPDMSLIIYPRSPRETMCGWMHLPRYIDKIRLQLTGQLPPDYRDNFGKGFDEKWLKAAGVTHEQMIDVVRASVTDGQVADWVARNVKKSEADKKAHRESMLNYPRPDDEAMQARLKMRKEQNGLAHRHDIKSFVDFIDADEKRM